MFDYFKCLRHTKKDIKNELSKIDNEDFKTLIKQIFNNNKYVKVNIINKNYIRLNMNKIMFVKKDNKDFIKNFINKYLISVIDSIIEIDDIKEYIDDLYEMEITDKTIKILFIV